MTVNSAGGYMRAKNEYIQDVYSQKEDVSDRTSLMKTQQFL